MPAFLENIHPFLGTGEKNEDGLDLAAYLSAYEPGKYINPSITTDVIIFCTDGDWGFDDGTLELLLIQRRNHPCIGYWALPGGFVNRKESLLEGAKRELMEETGVTGVPLKQLRVWGEVDRDPRDRVISVTYLSMISKGKLRVKAGDDAADAVWAKVILKQKETLPDQTEDFSKPPFEDRKIYELILQNDKKNIDISSEVLVSVSRIGPLKERTYEILENHGLAFDHAKLILQALLTLALEGKEQVNI